MLYAYKTPEGEILQETVEHDAGYCDARMCAELSVYPEYYELPDELLASAELGDLTPKQIESLGYQRVEVKAVEV